MLGFAAQAVLSYLLRDLVSGELPAPAADALWLGLVTAVVILVGFALPPLLQLKRVPPARVLRRNLEPPPLRYLFVYGLAIASVLALLLWLLRDAKLVLYLGAGIAATFIVLALAGRGAGQGTRAAARRRRRGLALRAREHRATRPRQRRADHRLRPGTDGAAAARAGARRPARGVARQPAGRCAQLLHDQHPPRRGRGIARFLCGSRSAAHRARADGSCTSDGHQRRARRPGHVADRGRARMARTRGEPHLDRDAAGGQPAHRRRMVARGRRRRTARLGRARVREVAGAQDRRPPDLRRRR